MRNLTSTLRERTNWVELLPIEGSVALVLRGNVHLPGDILRLPGRMTWEEATVAGPRDDTALSPFDLELVYDVVTGACFPIPCLEEIMAIDEELRRECPSMDDGNPLQVDEDMARAFGALLARKPERPRAESDLRRRRTDMAG